MSKKKILNGRLYFQVKKSIREVLTDVFEIENYIEHLNMLLSNTFKVNSV